MTPGRQRTGGGGLMLDTRKSCVTVGTVDSWLFIHSIVVVTCSMGVHTPPAFAATATMAPTSLLSSSFGVRLRNSDTMTMVTVRLFSIADRKKVKSPMT